MQFLTLISLASIALSSNAHPTRARRAASNLLTVPLRRLERDSELHVDLLHQKQINRAERLMARAAGLPPPSEAQLRANLARRASFIPDISKRSNSNISTTAFDDGGHQYFMSLELGTPPVEYNIVLDSGSSDFWVASSQCTFNGGSCQDHTFFDSQKSSSFVDLKQQFHITYGSGAASGEVVNDTLVLAGVQMKDFTFGIAHNISQEFATDHNIDSLMGLAKAGVGIRNAPPPQIVMRNRGIIDQAIVSFRLPRFVDHNVGEVTFGGLDSTKFDPSTQVTINSTNSGFWIIPLDGASVNGKSVKIQSNTGFMDTGTTLLLMPEADAVAVHQQIPGAQQKNGQFTIPCDTKATVSLTFGGKNFDINPSDLVAPKNKPSPGNCDSKIGVSAQSSTQWVVGDTFLQNVYFSTNIDENTVTLAKPI
uniref:Peptidase A1 domain-containing protein n=1 Tax=Mycena chlorophos TaxID=658473 RepID=A0ABQ0L6Q5_MYCCL|nr:predicted protein [Mycena chlorophos]